MSGKPTHGLSRTAEYLCWQNMRQRCESPSYISFADYGGRGITVCERWHLFVNFIADMGRMPARGFTLERIDNNKGYAPENCRWATRTEQQRNKRRQRNNSSGYVGVRFDKSRDLWRAEIKVSGREVFIGRFGSLDAAVAARRQAEQRYWYGQ